MAFSQTNKDQLAINLDNYVDLTNNTITNQQIIANYRTFVIFLIEHLANDIFFNTMLPLSERAKNATRRTQLQNDQTNGILSRTNTMLTKVTTISGSPGNAWLNTLLNNITNTNSTLIDQLQLLMGYLITGQITVDKLFILTGPGSKVIISLLKRCIGTYVVGDNKSFFYNSVGGSKWYNMDRRRILAINLKNTDLTAIETILTSIISPLTSSITATYPGSSNKNYNRQFKLLLWNNNSGVIITSSGGLQAKTLHIDLPGTTNNDRVMNHAKRTAFLNWALAGSVNWYAAPTSL